MTAQHWAADLIGRPWSPDGEGPDSFSCWGLVRWVFRLKHGVLLPAVLDEGNEVSVRGAMRAAHVSGWRPVLGALPEVGDVVMMRSATRLHVGLIEAGNGGAGVLHCASGVGVMFEPWADATRGMTAELWRRAC